MTRLMLTRPEILTLPAFPGPNRHAWTNPRRCDTCRHHDRRSGTCSNKRVRWDDGAGQPTLEMADAAEARAAVGRCGERGAHWEGKP